ncbi:MAG TPA: sialate O-acetylesterase [Terracidiphilus sp.]|nr:sialate O-acetylesterase [Terracidiphilus sp.]
MRNRKTGIGVLALALMTAARLSQAEVRLPSVFSDHAVLQRGQPVHIWGWAAPGETVTVHFHNQALKGAADANGKWQVWLMPEAAGGPYTVSIEGSQTATPVELHDILVGDVWLASGQSNMEFPLRGFPNGPLKNGAEEIAAANHPHIRLLLVQRATSDSPLSDVKGEWTECTPETAADFSAVAYFFGREISEREKVPVGLIDSTWGGTTAEPWVSLGALGRDDYSIALRDGAELMQQKGLIDATRANFTAQNTALQAEGKTALKPPDILTQYWFPRFPSVLFNAMIAPLTGCTIKGVIWYQGESDSGPEWKQNYARVFPLLIDDWRRQWREGNFPFLFVQISSFNSPKEEWGRVRDAQRQTLAVRNTGMAVTLDLGQADNVHPPDKQTVGDRLARIALATVYGEKIAYASPEFREATVEGDAIRVWFSHGRGLNTRGKPAGGFEVAGEDGVFVPATARIEEIDGESTVVVSSANVPVPSYVRYGWANVVTDYLYNDAGLPLGTFTSEESR